MKKIYYAKFSVWSWVSVAILVLSGCASAMPGLAQDERTAGKGSEDWSCVLPFAFSPEVFETRIVMLGDLHGTHETPQMAAGLACTLARNGTPVTLAIEMPHDEQAALDAYLASDGGDAARSALTARPFWQLRRDGLNTVATLAMIERIRALRRGGASLSILAIDASSADFSRPLPEITPEQERHVRTAMKELCMTAEQQTQIIEKLPGLIVLDRAMAQYMADAIRAEPERRFVVFLGNGHTGKVADVPIPGRPSMASILAPKVSSLLSLNTMAMKYLFWGCLSPNNGAR